METHLFCCHARPVRVVEGSMQVFTRPASAEPEVK